MKSGSLTKGRGGGSIVELCSESCYRVLFKKTMMKGRRVTPTRDPKRVVELWNKLREWGKTGVTKLGPRRCLKKKTQGYARGGTMGVQKMDLPEKARNIRSAGKRTRLAWDSNGCGERVPGTRTGVLSQPADKK